ncbi:MAG: hypothetical protein PHY15_08820 [Eubacteriales bacterium]|nr:hypothetical protein [Eubacteriales bacterium]MDD4475377.1 hypothetical protein [Eubacteriales bacterium]
MEKIINKLVEAEYKAHEFVDKASLDRDWATALHEKEFGLMKKKRYEEINALLAQEREQKTEAFKKENSEAELNHETEIQKMRKRFAEVSDEVMKILFSRVIGSDDKI